MSPIAKQAPRTLVVIAGVTYREFSAEEVILRLRKRWPTIDSYNQNIGRRIRTLVEAVGGQFVENRVPSRAPGDGYGKGLSHTSAEYLVPVDEFDRLYELIDQMGEDMA